MNNVLVYFTASYPYGTRETYLHNEVLMLSKYFEHIYILPMYNPTQSNTRRVTPSNVIVIDPLAPQGFSRIVHGFFNLSPFMEYLKEFFSENIYSDTSKLKRWFNSMLVYRIVYAKFKNIKKRIPLDAILYSYWAEAPLFTTKLCRDYTKVVRMHAGDFYLDRNKNYLPLRRLIYQKSDLLLPISEDIQQKLISYYNIDNKKIFLNYLGTYNDDGITINKQIFNNDLDLIRVVSCSNVYKLKRIDLIIDIFSHIKTNKKIEWHHFGTGSKEDMDYLKKKANELNTENIKSVFHGQVTQKHLYEFYRNNYVHWFINVSEHEGLPVSIMEAFSFGIPAIATDVGATKEIVDESNGYLIPKYFNPQFVSEKIISLNDEAKYRSKRNYAFLTWKERFNASRNYLLLRDKLKERS